MPQRFNVTQPESEMADNKLVAVTNEIYAARDDFEAVSIDRSINFEREAGFAVQIMQSSDYLLGIAMSAKQSVIQAVTNIAAIGISLNPAKKQAYLVPRDRKICLDISYMGLMDLAMATGSIMWAQAEVVREKDTFAKSGFDRPPLHEFNPFGKERGEIVGVYVVVKTASGDYLTHTMGIDAVYAIRARSESWKGGKASPWKSDPEEMIKKTCVKQAYKYWPKTDRLEKAIHHLNTDGGEGIELHADKPAGCPPEVLSAWTQKAKAAGTAAALEAIWKDGLAAIKPTKDMRAYETFKAVVSARGDDLKEKALPSSPAQPAPGDADDLDAEFQAQLAREAAQQ